MNPQCINLDIFIIHGFSNQLWRLLWPGVFKQIKHLTSMSGVGYFGLRASWWWQKRSWKRDSECYPHVRDTLGGNVNNQGVKLGNNACVKNRDVADVSHGVERVPMHHSTDETALSNNVIASNEHSGQQDVNQSTKTKVG